MGAETLPRLYVAEDLMAGATVALPQAHYLGAVLRRQPGDGVRLFNGRHGEWRAELSALNKRHAEARLLDRLRPQADEPGPTLVFALLKKARLDMLVEKAVELGVALLQPVTTRRTQADKIRPDRLHAQIVEAAEQCERLTLPALAALQPLDRVLDRWPDDRRLYAALARHGAPPIPANRQAGLLIGPEGGFDAAEAAALAAHPAVRPVSLGPRILRAETAAIAGLACLTRADVDRILT